MDDLGRRLARGDEAAFAELYDRCAGRILNYLALRLASREDAADVLQETFVRLVRTRRLEDVGSLVAYVFAAARNEAARFHGRQTRERTLQCRVAQQECFDAGESTPLEAQETAQLVTEALASLNEEQREVLALKIYGELTFREIAEITGVPQGTLATRYRAAMERLRGMLAKEHL